jgi:hypothetical protein
VQKFVYIAILEGETLVPYSEKMKNKQSFSRYIT